MRIYHATSFRALRGGSIELTGRWEGVRWIALALLPLLVLSMRSPLLLFGIGGMAVALFTLPARRRVLWDVQARQMLVEHAGVLAERWRRTIPFAHLQGLTFQRLERRGGPVRHALFAHTAAGRVYLVTYAGMPGTEALADRVRALMEQCETWSNR